MNLHTGLPNKARDGVVRILNTLLADEFVLYTRTRNYHWNVVGPRFHDLHKFFEEQYEALDEVIDEVAERVRAVGGRSAGTLHEFSKLTRLKEDAPTDTPDAQTMVANLLSDHEAIARSLRKDLEKAAELGDAGTSDFLTGLLEAHEKTAWMLRSTLEK